MSAVVADTHVVIWYLLHHPKLSAVAEQALDRAVAAASIYVASVSLVEVTFLVERGRLPETAYERLNQELVSAEGAFEIAPLDLIVAQHTRRIPRATVPELPDRIIAATALALNLPLVTRDLNLRALTLPTIW